MQVIHYLFKITDTDLIIFFNLTFDDPMEHHDHGHGPGRGVVGIPFILEILAGILDVGVRRIERIELTGNKGGWQGRRWANGRCSGGGGFTWNEWRGWV